MSSTINTSGITAGCIYRIYLQNFVTYNEVELYPGTSLNLIIGPNGTGKSTFVCAIVLGLCGKPNIIGRATKVSEYIRTGCEQAIIEIELYQRKGKKNVIIKRTILKKDISKWSIDNVTADEKRVQELIAQFNIQVDNLCQLLPQDRVHDFSKLNPQQLLKSTLSAIKGQESVNQLDRLIDTGKEKNSLKTNLSHILKQLEKLQRENERLKEEVEAMKKRNEFEEQIQICERKKLWIEYKELLRDVNTQKTCKRQADDSLKNCENALKPLQNKLNSLKKNINQMEQQRIAIGREIDNLKEITKTTIDSIISKEYVIKEAETLYKEKLEREKNKGSELNEAQLKLEKLINDKTSLEERVGNESDLKEKMNNIKQKLMKTNLAIDVIKKQRQGIEYELRRSIEPEIMACNNRLRTLQDVNNKRLDTLERYNRDTFNAVQWFRKNRTLFQHTVIEPMMLVINFTEPRFAAYLEATVPARDLTAFTFECKQDMKLFLLKVRKELGFSAVNAVCSSDRPRPAAGDITKLSYLGFYTYLSDTLAAPAAVESYLCRSYALHRVPLGDRHTYDNTHRVPPDVSCYFTEKHKFTVRRSAYTGEASSSIFEIRPPRLLANTLDVDRIKDTETELLNLQRKKQKIEEKFNVANSQLATLESQDTKISSEKKNIDKNIGKIEELSAFIRVQRRKTEELANDPAMNVESEKELCKKKQIEAVLIQCNLHQKLNKILKNLHDNMVKRQTISIKVSKSRDDINEQKSQLRESEGEFERQKALLENAERLLRQMTAKADEKITNLSRMCNNMLPNNPNFPYSSQFKSLPADLNQLQEHRYELETRMNAINPGDAQAIKEYEEKEKEIAKLKREETMTRNKDVELQESLNRLKRRWVMDIQEMIQNINIIFSQMFSRANCVGEVKLETGETEDDFSKYGIGIWAKFREKEEMMQLSRNTQSGGERALTTALYLLALQRLAAVPFRCVDEINQGMDSVNERKMLQILIRETTEFQNSQYFLLTPKLLPNLEYNEHVTIHTIMNGKEIMNYDKWNYKKFLEKARLHRRQTSK